MPRPGGEADKLGNHFEAAWTVNVVLDVFDGIHRAITVEPPGDLSVGVEFYVECTDGSRQFHSVKRQKTGGDWSIAELCRATVEGRSVLGDLFEKHASGGSVSTCFVSSTGANEIRELSERACKATDVAAFRRALSPELQAKFDKRLVPICANDEIRSFAFLQDLEVILHSHQHLVRTVERRIAGMLYRLDNSSLDPGDVRREIAEYLVERLGTRLCRDQIGDHLRSRGLGSRDWRTDLTISETVRKINERYVTMTATELINDAYIIREIVDEIIGGLDDHNRKGALVVAPGGFGKSCVIAQCLERLSATGTPFISVRLDSVQQCTTSRQLGEHLDLPASPAVVLAGIADNAPSVLVVDQLDAMSLVSGRNPDLWMAFSDLCADVQVYPRMKMILACRDFDLEHDYRLRPLGASNSGFSKCTLGKLGKDEVSRSLANAGMGDFDPSERQLDILGVPFHLLLFLQGQRGTAFRTTGQLYDSYWKRKLQNLRKRLGRSPRWNDVVDALTGRMSAEQVLFSPMTVVDEWVDDAQAMVSEHVLVEMIDQRQYRFFHESFFDYAYARRFASADRRVVDFLRSTEQHLFRRSQVRQILDYRRAHDPSRYISDLRDILESDVIRFHIKRMVASGFSRVESPRGEEWELLEPHLSHGPLSRYVSGALYSHVGWFDLMNSRGVFRQWLGSGHDARIELAIRYLEPPDLQELRSAEIASLISPYVQSGIAWERRIIRVMSWHKIHKSSQMRSLHVDMIESGSYDNYSGAPTGGGFWDQYYDVEKECPIFLIDVARTWFERAVQRLDDGASWCFLRKFVQNTSDLGAQLILDAARAEPKYFIERMLPVVVNAIVKTQHVDGDEIRNRLWPTLSNVGNPHSLDEAILLALRHALQQLAQHDSVLLRNYVTPLLQYGDQTAAYLVLSSLQENPGEFADECVQYLLDDHRRLDIGYGSWVSDGPGTGHCAITRRAIGATSSHCSDRLFTFLEAAIVRYQTAYEMREPKRRGFTELLLLRALDRSRMSLTGVSRVHELEVEFPALEDAVVQEDATSEAELIGSPIPKERAQFMTDDQWISAMQEYKDSSHITLDGGALELSRLLSEFAREDRTRFALLALEIPSVVDSIYFAAILDGLSGRLLNPGPERDADKRKIDNTDTDLFLGVLDRIHSLPGRPCGSAIVHCIRVLSDRVLPPRTLAMVSYYAVDDPDPQEDRWRKDGLRDPWHHGINCVRGQAAETISALLFEDETRLDILRSALDALARDRVSAVRTCALSAFLPLLNYSREHAVGLFLSACHSCDDTWSTVPFERFIHYAVQTHYEQLRPLLQSVLCSQDDRAVELAARQIALCELNNVDVGSDGDRVRAGSPVMRKAVVRVYARNIAKEIVGAVCMSRLELFLDDPEEAVRSEASRAFSGVSDQWLLRSKGYVSTFIESKAFESGAYDVLRVLEESNLAVPDVICRAAERVLGFLGEEGTHVAYRGSVVAKSIATLVVRQYQQAVDQTLKRRCLDLIDRMEEAGYFGIDTELAKLDR